MMSNSVSQLLDALNAFLPSGWQAGYVVRGAQAGEFYALPPNYRQLCWPRGVCWLGTAGVARRNACSLVKSWKRIMETRND